MEKRYHGLLKEMEVARRRHHDAVVRAKTKVYENKAVIGGTIVGCITRLEAIRLGNKTLSLFAATETSLVYNLQLDAGKVFRCCEYWKNSIQGITWIMGI